MLRRWIFLAKNGTKRRTRQRRWAARDEESKDHQKRSMDAGVKGVKKQGEEDYGSTEAGYHLRRSGHRRLSPAGPLTRTPGVYPANAGEGYGNAKSKGAPSETKGCAKAKGCIRAMSFLLYLPLSGSLSILFFFRSFVLLRVCTHFQIF